MMDESWFYIGRERPTYLIPLKEKMEIKKAITHIRPDPAALTPTDMTEKKRLPVL